LLIRNQIAIIYCV